MSLSSTDVGRDAMSVLETAGLEPLDVFVVEPDCICYVDLRGRARTVWLRATAKGSIVIEAVVDGWPV